MPWPKRRLSRGLLLSFALLLSVRTWASPDVQTVLVFVEDADGPLAHRMRAEFVALGFDVNLQATQTVGESSLEELARAAHAIAAIRVDHNDVGVEMSIMDRTTGKTTSRSISIPSGSEPPAPELVVLRTVELLRASLLELEAPHPNRGDVPAGPKVRALLPPRPPAPPVPPETGKFALAGGANLRETKGASMGFDLQLSLDIRPFASAPVSTRIGLRLPLRPMRITSTEGSTDVSALSLTGAFLFNVGKPASRAFADLGLGYAADWLSTSGNASGDNSGRTARGVVFSPFFVTDAGLRLGAHSALRLDGSLGCALPSATIRFAGRDVAEWACPWFSAGTSAVVSWP